MQWCVAGLGVRINLSVILHQHLCHRYLVFLGSQMKRSQAVLEKEEEIIMNVIEDCSSVFTYVIETLAHIHKTISTFNRDKVRHLYCKLV